MRRHRILLAGLMVVLVGTEPHLSARFTESGISASAHRTGSEVSTVSMSALLPTPSATDIPDVIDQVGARDPVMEAIPWVCGLQTVALVLGVYLFIRRPRRAGIRDTEKPPGEK